ncbi:hypothetical protein ACHAXN_012433, partial [Cyclotella atomus]
MVTDRIERDKLLLSIYDSIKDSFSFSSDDIVEIIDFIWVNFTSKHTRKYPMSKNSWSILEARPAVDELVKLAADAGKFVDELGWLFETG